MSERCSARNFASNSLGHGRIRFLAGVLLLISFLKLLFLLGTDIRMEHRVHRHKNKARALWDEVPFLNRSGCSQGGCGEFSSERNFQGSNLRKIFKKHLDIEQAEKRPWNQSGEYVIALLTSLLQNNSERNESENITLTNVASLEIEKAFSTSAGNGSKKSESVVQWEYFFSETNKIILNQLPLEIAVQYAKAYTVSAKKQWLSLNKNFTSNSPEHTNHVQHPNIKRIWIWGRFWHQIVIHTKAGTNVTTAGERCSCTTAITDIFRRNFDMQCSERGADTVVSAPPAQNSSKRTVGAVPVKCVIGGLPWKHGACRAPTFTRRIQVCTLAYQSVIAASCPAFKPREVRCGQTGHCPAAIANASGAASFFRHCSATVLLHCSR